MKFRRLLAAVCLLIFWGTFLEGTLHADSLVLDRVRFYPQPGMEGTMVGGRIEGSNVSAQEGYQVLAEIKTSPPGGQWTEIKLANTVPYRWIKYEGPTGIDSAVAEMEFYAGSQKLAPGGILDFQSFGVAGGAPWHEWRKAFDGKLNYWAEAYPATATPGAPQQVFTP